MSLLLERIVEVILYYIISCKMKLALESEYQSNVIRPDQFTTN